MTQGYFPQNSQHGGKHFVIKNGRLFTFFQEIKEKEKKGKEQK